MSNLKDHRQRMLGVFLFFSLFSMFLSVPLFAENAISSAPQANVPVNFDSPVLTVFAGPETVQLGETDRLELATQAVGFWNKIRQGENFGSLASPDGRWEAKYHPINAHDAFLDIKDTHTGSTFHNFLGPSNAEREETFPGMQRFSIDLLNASNKITPFPDSGLAAQVEVGRTLDRFAQEDPAAAKEVLDDALVLQELRQTWSDKSLDTMDEVWALYQKGLQVIREKGISQNLNDPKVLQQMILHQVVFFEDASGVVELNAYNGFPFIRVVHKGTELSIAIVQEGSITQANYQAFQLWLMRQHYDAGKSRSDGQRGRDVVVIQVPNLLEALQEDLLQPENITRYNRPQMKEDMAQATKEYTLSLARMPNASTALFGITCGLAQVACSCGAMGLKILFNPAAHFSWIPAALSAVYGIPIGVGISTYRNWSYRGTGITRALKIASIASSFAWILAGLMNPDQLHSVWFNVGLALNVLGNSVAKKAFYDIARSRELANITQGQDVQFNFLGKQVTWARPSVENQTLYLIPYTLKLLYNINITLMGVPFGNYVLYGSIPVTDYLVMRYFQKLALKDPNNKKVREMALEYEKKFKVGAGIFKNPRLRSLLLKKAYAKLTRNKERLVEVQQQLAAEFAPYFVYKTTHEAVDFQFPQQEQQTTKWKIENGVFMSLMTDPYLQNLHLRRLYARLMGDDETLRATDEQLKTEYPRFYDSKNAPRFNSSERPCDLALQASPQL
ncbi:MAG: hypothetical protein WCG27_01350 [Pseudomonadota bacterium]